MSEETANEETLEEETAPAEAAAKATEDAEAAPAEAAAEAGAVEDAAEAAPAPEVVAPAPEVVAPAAEVEAPAAEVVAPAAEVEAPAAEVEAPAAEVVAPAAVEAPAADDNVRFDKLKKAEEILRSSAPHSSRESAEDTFEKVVHINRCSKVVKGGRRFSFSALVVSGDKDGRVGFGFGKAQEVSECIKKASEASKKDMVAVNITENTIPHPVIGEHGGGRVLLRPASPGTGLIAGGGVRAVVEAAGIKDVLAKSMGSNNPANVVKATMNALEQLRSKEQIYSIRGKRLAEKKAL